MESTYTTKQGDVWDKIAYEVYGDEEYTGWLMENNFPLLDTFVFDAPRCKAPSKETAPGSRRSVPCGCWWYRLPHRKAPACGHRTSKWLPSRRVRDCRNRHHRYK